MAEEVIDMERTCRGCLREGLRMQPLFAEPRLHLMLMSSTQLEITKNDGLPYQICIPCKNQLSSAFTFKQMCRQSDAKLRLYMAKVNSTTKTQTQDNSSELKPFNQETHPVKIESDGVIMQTDDIKLIEIKNDSPLNLINSNEKFTQTKTSDSMQKIYSCVDCTKKFSSASGLRDHMKYRHDIGDASYCVECLKPFDNHSQLKKHYLEEHKTDLPEQVKAPLVCLICKKTFQSTNLLKQHVLIHGKKKIYNCTTCDRGFNKYQNYEKHRLQCLKDDNICSVCMEKFSTPEALLMHAATHSTSEKALQDNCVLNEDKDPMSTLHNDIIYQADALDIKEEPLEELLEEADRENRLINEDGNSLDGGDLSMGEYSEEAESDASEYLSEIKVKKKVGRPCKNNKKYFKPLKRNERILKYRCNQCPRKLSSSLRLKIHMEKHYSDQETTYSCDDCDQTFRKASELKKHERAFHPTKEYKCNSCDKSFHRQENLEKHMWQHTENKPHPCDKCPKGFMREEHLQRHKLAIHSNKKKNPKKAFCTICNRGFTTEKYLETHMRMHTGDKTYTCKICNKSFNTKWHLKEHMKWHSAEKPFLCSECGQRFIRNDYLITHMRRHNGEKPYKCKFCNKGFPRATDLTVHERYHTGEKTHLCTICGKGFQRQYNLTVHLRVHTGEKPYVCTYCGKRFAQGNDLKSHVRRHTGERFKCDICGESFIQGYHLTQHKRGIHGIQCSSHIRRVEKHPQGNTDLSTSKAQVKTAPNQLGIQLVSTVNQNAMNATAIVNSSNEAQSSRLMDGASLNIPHCPPTLQSSSIEIDLSQRSHAMPALMPIVPVALFPNIHSRI